MWLNCNLGKANANAAIGLVHIVHNLLGALGVHHGRSHAALHSSDRCGSVPLLAILCRFISTALPSRRAT